MKTSLRSALWSTSSALAAALTVAPLQAQRAAPQAAPIQQARAVTTIVPVHDVQTAATWTKPQLPQAPLPKLPRQKSKDPLPVGAPSWEVVSPPTPAVPEAGPITGSASPAAGTVTVHSKPLATWSGQSRSTVSEPSAAWFGNTCLFTHNWDAAIGIGAGGTSNPIWTRRDPRSLPRVDGGFCCDQLAYKCDGSNELLIWFLQYSNTSTRGSVRIVTYTSEANLIAGISHSYVLSPQNFGWPSGYWFDYPSVSSTDDYVYFTSNVFSTGSANSREGVVCWRMNLADMKARRNVSIGSFKRESRTFCWRLAQNGLGGDTAYWWFPKSTTSGTVYRWPENSGTITWRDITVGAFTGQLGRPGPYSFTGAGSTNILGRIDWRSTGGWVGRDDTLHFMWTCAARSGRGAPYIRWLRLNAGNITFKNEVDIWNNSVMFAYPCGNANRRGDAGGTLAYCSSTGRPTTMAWMHDDLVSSTVDLVNPYGGANSPTSSSWGDYMTCQPHPTRRNSFVATAMVMDNGGGGNTNQRPFYAYFGRARDNNSLPDLEVVDFSTSSTTLEPGKQVTLGATIKNVGNATAAASTASFRLSSNDIISTSDTLLASISVPARNVGFTVSYSRTVTVPARAASPADCWVGFLADETGAVSESHEGNNSASAKVRCLQSKPDLTVETMNASNAVAGGTGSFTWVVRNIGKGPSLASTNVGLFLSTNSTITTLDELLRVDSLGTLGVNSSSQRSSSFAVPHCYTSSTGYIGAIVDQDGTIAEDNENNNSRASSQIQISTYVGGGRFVEWAARWGGGATSAKGSADLRLVNGPRSIGMCVTAPQSIGDWHLCLWSASSGFSVDALTNLSLGLINGPLLPGHLGRVPSSGRSYPSLSLPQQSGVSAFSFYVHTVWFSGDFTNFLGLGSNAVRATIRS